MITLNSFYVSKASKKTRTINFTLFTAAILIIGFGYYFLVKAGYGLHCPFNYLFHVDCPFCGLTRMCVNIIELHFIKAFYFHVVAFTFLPVICIIYLRVGIRYIKTGITSGSITENRIIMIFIYVLLIFTVFRNLI